MHRIRISELLSRYAMAYDARSLADLRGCFADDLVFETRLRGTALATFRGAEHTVAGMASVMAEQGPRQRRHLVTNVVVRPTGHKTAEVSAYALVVVADDEGVELSAMAVYDCSVRLAPSGEWLLTRLLIDMDGYVGAAPRRDTGLAIGQDVPRG